MARLYGVMAATSVQTFRYQTTKGLDRGSFCIPTSDGNGRNIKNVKACGVNQSAIYSIHALPGQGAPTPFKL